MKGKNLSETSTRNFIRFWRFVLWSFFWISTKARKKRCGHKSYLTGWPCRWSQRFLKRYLIPYLPSETFLMFSRSLRLSQAAISQTVRCVWRKNARAHILWRSFEQTSKNVSIRTKTRLPFLKRLVRGFAVFLEKSPHGKFPEALV